MKFSKIILPILLILVLAGLILYFSISRPKAPVKKPPLNSQQPAAPVAAPVPPQQQTPAASGTVSQENPAPITIPAPPATSSLSSFSDNFDKIYTLEEAPQSLKSNPDWWLNSGAYFYSGDGMGKTTFGDLPAGSKWRTAYAKSNPDETDKGLHPQNIFRLVTRSKWQNLEQQVYYNMQKYNLSESSNRQQSNGFFLFNRYEDGNNLYYTGLRVDGTVSIKKKSKGVYYEMASAKVIAGVYDRDTNPTLIPVNQWIGLKSRVYNNANGTVTVEIYVDLTGSGNWQKVLQAVDDGKSYGGPVIAEAGYGGIRTDFMDVEFENYSISEIAQ